MAKSELGTKRVDPETGRKFYDLNKDPIVSPYTGKTYPRSYFEEGKIAAIEEEEEVAEKEVDAEEEEGVEVVSLEEADDEAKGRRPARSRRRGRCRSRRRRGRHVPRRRRRGRRRRLRHDRRRRRRRRNLIRTGGCAGIRRLCPMPVKKQFRRLDIGDRAGLEAACTTGAVPTRADLRRKRRPATAGKWGHSSAGRAPAWHAGGQRFDPAWLHQKRLLANARRSTDFLSSRCPEPRDRKRSRGATARFEMSPQNRPRLPDYARPLLSFAYHM